MGSDKSKSLSNCNRPAVNGGGAHMQPPGAGAGGCARAFRCWQAPYCLGAARKGRKTDRQQLFLVEDDQVRAVEYGTFKVDEAARRHRKTSPSAFSSLKQSVVQRETSAGTAIVPHTRAHVPRWRGGLQNRLWWVRFPTVRARPGRRNR